MRKKLLLITKLLDESMGFSYKILFRTLVKPFYAENKGVLVFIFTMMFFIVSEQSGAGLYEYHYSLVTGMLSNYIFLLFVLFVWLLYARKCVAFVSNKLDMPEYNFLHILNSLSKAKRIRLFFLVEIWLMMPIIIYSIFITFNGLQQHFYIPLLITIIFLALLCLAPAIWYTFLLNNPQKFQLFSNQNKASLSLLIPTYQVILLRFISNKQKIIWIGIKVFTCGILYLVARNNTSTEYDAPFAFMFFNFGILANGVIIYRIREFEESYLSSYRGLPITLLKRFLEYSLFYFLLLIPEFFTGIILTPNHLHYIDAINFSLCGYSLLLLMNSITFLQNFSMKDYLKILLLIFCVEFIFLMAFGLTVLYCFFLIFAFALFFKAYYRFEQSV